MHSMKQEYLKKYMQTRFFSFFSGRQYTFIAVNPDIADNLGTPGKPYVVTLASNLAEDQIAQLELDSRSVLPYKLPAMSSALASPQKLFFLLFEQQTTEIINPSSLAHFAESTDCPSEYAGRCRFDLSQFVRDNHLLLRGVNWITVKSDAVTRSRALLRKSQREDVVCRDQPQYSATCPKASSGRENPDAVPPFRKSAASIIFPNFRCIFISTFLLTFAFPFKS
jgi:hypothetical protein